jgi:hypothetical protein
MQAGSKFVMLGFWILDHIIGLGKLKVLNVNVRLLVQFQMALNMISIILSLGKYSMSMLTHAKKDDNTEMKTNIISILKFMSDIPSVVNGIFATAPINEAVASFSGVLSALFSIYFITVHK